MKEDVIITQTNRVIIFHANCTLTDLGECISRSQLDCELAQAMYRKNCGNGSVYYSNGAYYSTIGGNTNLYHRFKFL